MQSTANYLWHTDDLLGQGATASVYKARNKVGSSPGGPGRPSSFGGLEVLFWALGVGRPSRFRPGAGCCRGLLGMMTWGKPPGEVTARGRSELQRGEVGAVWFLPLGPLSCTRT